MPSSSKIEGFIKLVTFKRSSGQGNNHSVVSQDSHGEYAPVDTLDFDDPDIPQEPPISYTTWLGKSFRQVQAAPTLFRSSRALSSDPGFRTKMVCFGILSVPLVVAVVAYVVHVPATLAKAGVFQVISDLQEQDSTLLKYPTQITQGIMPKFIHSHNDYWRDVPFLTALSYGVASIEADVWLQPDGTLFVGHESAALTPDRTFDSLYIKPILEVLAKTNPKDEYTKSQKTPNGVFDTSSGQTLQLLVDMKTDGNSTYPAVYSALKPLREKGYLTTYNGTTLTPGPVTVIGTGSTPLALVQAETKRRDLFKDAELQDLSKSESQFNKNVTPLASTDFAAVVGWNGIGNISDKDLQALKGYVDEAHKLGIKARFWDTPAWPIFARDAVWKVLLDIGADWLNADDLEAASEF